MKRIPRILKIAVGYVIFMTVFYIIGGDNVRFQDFIAVLILTGVYAGLVKTIVTETTKK